MKYILTCIISIIATLFISAAMADNTGGIDVIAISEDDAKTCNVQDACMHITHAAMRQIVGKITRGQIVEEAYEKLSKEYQLLKKNKCT